MKRFFTNRMLVSAVCASLGVAFAVARTSPSLVSTSEMRVAGMSPDGNIAVGYHSPWDNSGLYRSGTWIPSADKIEWITEHDDLAPDKGGNFACVNNDGAIGGSVKDPATFINYFDEYQNRYVQQFFRAGAIWRDDKLYILPTPGFGVNDYSDENDGGAVIAISADALHAAGNVIIAWMPMSPVVWNYDADADAYDAELLDLPREAMRGVVKGMSADGSVIVGTANVDTGEGTSRQFPCVWQDGVPALIYPEEITTTTWCETIAVSQNGRWVVFGFSGTEIGQLDLASGEIKMIPVPKTLTSVGIGGVDDDGNFVGQSIDPDGKYSNLYYSRKYNVVCTLDYLLEQMDTFMELPENMKRAFLSGISSDGSKILGIDHTAYGETAYWLDADIPSLQMMASVAEMQVFTSSPDAITVAWTPNPEYGADGASEAIAYNIYFDDALEVSFSPEDVPGMRHVFLGLAEGLYQVSMSVTYLKGGREIESVKTEPMEVCVNKDTTLPFFDDFEVPVLDPFLWTRRWEGVPGEIMTWGTVSGDDYENMTSHTQTFSISTMPYSNRITSRWMDATDASEVYLSTYLKLNLLNFPNQDLRMDFLDVDISFDGENWETVASVPASGMALGVWDMLDVDLSAVAAGRVFQLRLNSYGDGRAQIRWFMDLFKVGVGAERAAVPALHAVARDKGNMVHFASSAATYEAGYVLNSNLLTDYNIGNEGKDFIAAISLDSEQLADFDGMWLRGATAFIFDNPSLNAEPTTAEVMVWEDGELVSSNMVDKEYLEPVSSFLPLDEPVRIDASKEYKVGIAFYANHRQQAPIYYQCAEGLCLPGRSDLFSEDEGKTWQRVSEVLTGDSRHCIWSIRANITPDADDAVADECESSLLGFNVYRHDSAGSQPVKVNEGMIYAAAPRILDYDGMPDASYSVVAYHINGDKTLSTTPKETVSAVETVDAVDVLDVAFDGEKYRIGGAEVRSISLYDTAGRLIAIVKGNSLDAELLVPGVNVAKARTMTSTMSVKIMK